MKMEEEEDVLKLLFDDDHNSNDLELVDEELERELLDDHDEDDHSKGFNLPNKSQSTGRARFSPVEIKTEIRPSSPTPAVLAKVDEHDIIDWKTKKTTDDLYHPLSEESIKRARLNVKNRRKQQSGPDARNNNKIEFNNRTNQQNANFPSDRKPLLPNLPNLLNPVFNTGNSNGNIINVANNNGIKFMPPKVPLTLRPMPSSNDGNMLFFPQSAPKPPLLQHIPLGNNNNFSPNINLTQINQQPMNLPMNLNSANSNFQKPPLLPSFPIHLSQLSSFQNSNSLFNQNDSQFSPNLSNNQQFFNGIQPGNMPTFSNALFGNSVSQQKQPNNMERNMPLMGSNFMNSNLMNNGMKSQIFTANQLPSNFNLQPLYNQSSGNNGNNFQNNVVSQSRGNFSNNVTIPITNEPLLLLNNNMRDNIGKRLGKNPLAAPPQRNNNQNNNSAERHINVNNNVQIQTQNASLYRPSQNLNPQQRLRVNSNHGNNSRNTSIMDTVRNATASFNGNGGQMLRPKLSVANKIELKKPLIAETPTDFVTLNEKPQPIRQKLPIAARLEPKIEPKVEPKIVVNTEAPQLPPPPGTIAVDKIKEVLGINEKLLKKKNEINSLREKMEKLKAAKRKIPESPKKVAQLAASTPAFEKALAKALPKALAKFQTSALISDEPLPDYMKDFAAKYLNNATCAQEASSSASKKSFQEDGHIGWVFSIQEVPSKPAPAPTVAAQKPTPTKPSTKVKITGLSVNTRESAIRKISRPCGMVKNITFEEDAGTGERFATVEFEQVAFAQKFLDTYQQHQLDSCNLTLSFVNWFVLFFLMSSLPTLTLTAQVVVWCSM